MSRHLAIKDYISESELFRLRCFILTLGIFLLSLLLVGRLIYLQVIEHQLYTTLSTQNQMNLVPIEPNRGLIFDRNGVLLAENIPGYALEMVPEQVKNLDNTLKSLGTLLKLSPSEIASFKAEITKRRSFDAISLKDKLSEKDVAAFEVNRYRFPGVYIRAHLVRHYPLGSTFAHVIGYVGRINANELATLDTTNYSASNYIGKIGIEKYYEDHLHGTVGYQQVEIDASGRVVRTVKYTPPVSGEDIYLTIDSNLQVAAEKALTNNKGAVVAINPNNGEVLALASTPTFDPNQFVNGLNTETFQKLHDSPDQPLFNRAIRGQYPPASTIKPILALEGLNTGAITLHSTIFDPGWFQAPNNSHLYRDWIYRITGQGHGKIGLYKAIVESCDTYFFNLAELMGIDHLDTIMRDFGLGSSTGVDMNEELSGLVASPTWKLHAKKTPWYPGDTITSGIGQSFMLATPIQLANVAAAISTHGKRFMPHLFMKGILEDGNQIQQQPIPLKPVVLKHSTWWSAIIDAMEGVVDDPRGTGKRFGQDSDYEVAAKTGTAQVFSIKQDEEYVSNGLPVRLRDHSLFIAFAPVVHPKIAVAVVVENNPDAASVARTVIDYYLEKPTHASNPTHQELVKK